MNAKIGGSSPPRAVEQILSLSQLLGARLSGLRLPPAFPAARPAEKKSAAWWETFWFEAAACFPRRPARRTEIRELCHVALSSTSGKWLWAGKRIDNYCPSLRDSFSSRVAAISQKLLVQEALRD